MAVDSKHPHYTNDIQVEWKLMRNAYAGQSAIKAAAELYLPKPGGYAAAEDKGIALYKAYMVRADFPEILSPTISAMIGLIHGGKIEINMPDSMSYLLERSTNNKLSLDAFHRRITKNLLLTGRYAVLADAPVSGGNPYLCGYAGETVINWSNDGEFFVVDDSGPIRTGFDWEDETRRLVFELKENAYIQTEYAGENDNGKVITPTGTGGKTLDRVPFVVANAVDISPDVITPPLIGISRSSVSMYQLSADYRWQLFMSGQETLVAINGQAPNSVGAGVVHSMEGAEGQTPDLKYVSPTCSGIDAHERALERYRRAAILAGARLLDQDNTSTESGKARKLRLSSETATLQTIAKSSCELLEQSLRNVAMMQGLSDTQQAEITVVPPEDLMDHTITPQDVKALVESWQSGGYSYRTLYENLQKGGIASPERTIEEELLSMDEDPEALRLA